MSQESCPLCSKWDLEPDLRIAEFDVCYALLNRDQFFPGYTFVVSKKHVTELFHMDENARNMVMEEVTRIAKALDALFRPDKINYELLGNMVPHMHWHIIPRFRKDKLWPRPIWSEPHTEQSLTKAEYAERIELIRGKLRE